MLRVLDNIEKQKQDNNIAALLASALLSRSRAHAFCAKSCGALSTLAYMV